METLPGYEAHLADNLDPGRVGATGPAVFDADLATERDALVWAARQREAVMTLLAQHGAVLVRGLGVASADGLAGIATALGVASMTEREAFAPRRSYPGGVLSSSQWPADEPMCMHHELSYANVVPSILLFGCVSAARRGGGTAVADSHHVLRQLPAAVRDRFTREGWLLTRVYHEAGVHWREAFGTDEPAAVADYCAKGGIEHEWLPGDRLLTRQRRAAVVRHPTSGIPVWFNQVTFLNEHTLDPVVRDYLLDIYGALPFNTAYGDGGELDQPTVDLINDQYRVSSAAQTWRDGDLLLVDNLRMAHGREPYKGDREVLVVLGNPVRLTDHMLPGTAAEGD
jgi:alpha-ketoglutarate-dependent taurine dioxygenase